MNSPSARVLVTGGRGFLGRHVTEALTARGFAEVTPIGRGDCDLVDPSATRTLFADLRPTAVVHLAAAVGGIGANVEQPGWFSYANTMMGANVLECARATADTTKVVTIGTVCVYPGQAPVPTPETAVFDGYPAPATAPYGEAKRNLLVMGQAYRAQYGLDAVYVIPTNLYGPGDHFAEDRSHVIPALIRRFLEARDAAAPHVEVWGDGSATRDFLYVGDAAAGIADALEQYDEPEPVNLGTGVETSMRELVEVIRHHTGFRGELRWDPSKPTGAPRRSLDIGRARRTFGFAPRVGVDEGIRLTTAWYEGQRGRRDG